MKAGRPSVPHLWAAQHSGRSSGLGVCVREAGSHRAGLALQVRRDLGMQAESVRVGGLRTLRPWLRTNIIGSRDQPKSGGKKSAKGSYLLGAAGGPTPDDTHLCNSRSGATYALPHLFAAAPPKCVLQRVTSTRLSCCDPRAYPAVQPVRLAQSRHGYPSSLYLPLYQVAMFDIIKLNY